MRKRPAEKQNDRLQQAGVNARSAGQVFTLDSERDKSANKDTGLEHELDDDLRLLVQHRVPLLLFPTAGYNGAPRWRKGWPVTFVFFFLLLAGFVAAVVLHRRKRRVQALNDLAELAEGDIGA